MTERDHQKPMIVRLAEDFAEDCIKAGYVSTILPSHARLMEAARALHSELKPVTHLIERHAFSVSPHGQDAEGHSWLEEAHSPDEKGAFAVYSSSQVMEMMRRYKDTLDGSSA